MASLDPMLDAIAAWRAANRVLCAACQTFETGPVVDACLKADRDALLVAIETTATTGAGWNAMLDLFKVTMGELPRATMLDCLDRSHRKIFAGHDPGQL